MAPRPPRSLAALLADIQQRPSVYFPALGKGPAGRTAQAATYLNYGPQFDVLNALLGSARQERRSTIQSAQRSGLAGSQGIQAIRDSFVTGAQDRLGGLGGPVAPGAATSSPEQRAAQQLGLSGTAVAGMLSTMAGQQIAGIGNQSAQARRGFSSARNEIGGKLASLLGQAGAYDTQQFTALAGEQKKARADALKTAAARRIQLMTAGINPDTGQYDPSLDKPETPTINQYGVDSATWAAMTPAQRQKAAKDWKQATGTGTGGRPDKGPGSATAADTKDFRREYQTALHWANTLKRDLAPEEIVQVLIQGRPSKPKYEIQEDPETGKKKRVRVGTIPGIDPVSDPMAIKAAVQEALYEGVKRGLAKRLRQSGYRLSDLGISQLTAEDRRRLREEAADAFSLPWGG